MRKDERLRTIYETIAPHITRNESNWRDYLSFGAQFFKHPFDNILLVYAQNPNVTMLATTKQWNQYGRYVNKDAKGLAVCEYVNSKLTLKHFFDISQTNGREIKPTDWQLADSIKAEMVNRLSFSHGFEANSFNELLYKLAAEAVGDHYEIYLQELSTDIEEHLFSEIPKDGFEAQFLEILTDSVIYFIGKRCFLPDEELHIGNGMATISHFNTLPLVARLGNAVTSISKNILLEMERTIRNINKERTENHEKTISGTELHRERRSITPGHPNLQRQGERSAPRQIRQDGDGIPEREPSAAVYDFENGWHSDGENAQGERGILGENRNHLTADVEERADTGYRGHTGTDTASEQPAEGSGGNRPPRTGTETEITGRPDETIEKESSKDGSFFVPYTPDVSMRWRDRLSDTLLPLPFEEGVPAKDKVLAVREWLKQNDSIYIPTYTVMYHGTGIGVPVLEKGLLPTTPLRRRSYQSESGYVYLANTPERAKNFGDLGNSSRSIVYEVLVPVNKLSADTDQLTNLRAAGVNVGNSLAESIVYGGGARVKGALELWQIKPFDYEGYRKTKQTAFEAENQAGQPVLTDEQIRHYYERILTSAEMYPAEMYGTIRGLFAQGDLTLEQKAESLAVIYSAYGDMEYQDDVLYRTVIRGSQGISFSFGGGYTYMPWFTIANIIEVMMVEGEYPQAPEQEQDSLQPDDTKLHYTTFRHTPYMVGDELWNFRTTDVIEEISGDEILCSSRGLDTDNEVVLRTYSAEEFGERIDSDFYRKMTRNGEAVPFGYGYFNPNYPMPYQSGDSIVKEYGASTYTIGDISEEHIELIGSLDESDKQIISRQDFEKRLLQGDYVKADDLYDKEIWQHYENALTSMNLYPDGLYRAVNALFSQDDISFSDKAGALGVIYEQFGTQEYQGDARYRVIPHSEDGMTLYIDDEQVQMSWDTVANIIAVMMDEGNYPTPTEQELQPEPIGDFNIPDEVYEMGVPDYQQALYELESVIADARKLLEESDYAVSDELIDYAIENLNTDGIHEPSGEQIAEQVLANLTADQQEQDAFDEILNTVSELEQADAANEESQQLSLFNLQSFDVQVPNVHDLFMEYSSLFVSRVLFDEAYLKMREGFTDEQKAKTECAAAVDRILKSLPLDKNAGIHQVYSTDAGFRKRLTDYVFEKTYTDFVKSVARIERMVQPKAERKNTAAHRNYRTFVRLFPQIISGEYRYLHLESSGFEPLSVERLGANRVSIMHTFTQNGDLMYDPDIVIELDSNEETVQAVSYEQSDMGLYQEVYAGNRINTKLQKDINSFLSDWLNNIVQQGFLPTRAVALVNDEDINIAFDADGKPVKPQDESKTVHDTAGIRILDESVGAHNGQIDMRLQAVQDDLTVGVILYSIYQDTPYISNIEVLQDYRRQGIGTKMIRYLQEQFPETEIEWGMTTDDGTVFKEAVTYSLPNEDYTAAQNRLNEINGQLEQNETDWNAGVIFSVERDEEWNDSEDEKRELEEELSELKPQTTFVRLLSDGDVNAPALPDPKTAVLPEPVSFHSDTNERNSETTPAKDMQEQQPVHPVKINFHYSEDYGLYPSGAKTKYKNNIEAIRLLKKIESERRLATAEEQIILARYVGWGGLANAFSDKTTGWEKEYQELKLLLDENEYRGAMNSTITAYYTEPELIRYIYKALEHFGFQGGPDRRLLDPAFGTGNFYSVMPETLADTKLYGAELDSVTGRLAQQLYQTADISVMGYEDTPFMDNSFDGAIGNIPFNSIKVFDERYSSLDFLIHDYFFAKTLDLVKPGGIIAFITSKGTLDKADGTVRRYIAERAEFIGAIRLPNTAFKSLAGTEVTTDILFLKKRDQIAELTDDDEFSWIDTETDRSKYIRYNYYFFEHPEMILGEMQSNRNMYGREDGTACIAPEGQDLYAELDHAIGRLHATFTAEADQPIEEAEEPDEESEYADAPEGVKNCTYVVQDGQIYYCDNKKLIPQDYTGKKAERISGLCEIRTALLEVIGVQSREYQYYELEQAQAKLNEVYDRFIKKNDAINCKGNILAFSDDDQFPLLRSIEDERKDRSGWDKSAVFTKATIKSYRRPDHADTAEEALQISLNEKMKVDLPYMSYLTGSEPEQLISELSERIYLNPHKFYGNELEGWELAEEYLSGHVRDKLLYARQKAEESPERFTRNVEALEAAQPAWLEPSDINVRISAPWVPIEYYRQFMYETFDTPASLRIDDYANENSRIDVEYLEYTTTWRISNKSSEKESVKVNQIYGTKRINAYQIYEDTLNQQSATVRDPVPYVDKNGKEQIKYVVNANETMIARAKQNQIREAFASWIWRDEERREALLKIYNERFNTIKPREYDGSHLVFPGMSNEEKLRPHQLNFAARVIYSGTGLAAHEVGAGKTAALIAAGMYMKRIGAIKKPVYTVPNSLTSQWATEFYRFFPNANILVTTIKDFEKQNRNKFISKIAMNDYDAIIIGHSQFERIPISRQRQEKQLRNEINQLTFAIEQVKKEKGENWAIKQMVIFQNNLQTRLKKLSAEFKKDDLLTFEQLGVDFMMVDEAHYFKNCFTYTKMRNVAGIGKAASQRASDMLMKCQYLQEVNNGTGVVFATGTPISNSMSEMFVMQRFLQPQELARLGLTYFDNWAATFGEITSSLEITPEGNGYRMRQRFSKFHNLPELMSIFKLVADIQTAEMLDLPTPELEGGKPAIVAVEATPYQKMIMDSFVERAEKIRNRKVDPSIDNMLKLTGEARLMAIDPRLVYEDAPNDPNTKLNRCIEDTYSIWEETKEKSLTQLVFCDSGTPKPGKFNVYDEFKGVLMEKGVPAGEIAFVHDATTETQRDDLFEKVRRGEIRVLLGSTSMLGTGVNVQNKLFCTHDLDCPWKPSDLIQRSGRILRQGNDNPVVRIRRYVTKGTFDSYLWQIQEQKLRYITQVMTGKSIARSCEDMDETVLTAAEVKAIATDNPMLAEKMEVDNEVARLKIIRGNWQNERAVLERNISRYYPERIAHRKQTIEKIGADLELLKNTNGQDFKITIDGKVFDERVPAGEHLMLLSRLDDWKDKDTPLPAGGYRGLELSLEHGSFDSIKFTLKGTHTYRGDLGSSELGAISRIENGVDHIPKLLATEKSELANFERQLEEAQKEVIKPFEYEQQLSEYAARQSEINTKLEFKELQKQEEVIMDEDTKRSDDEQDQSFERVPASVGAEV